VRTIFVCELNWHPNGRHKEVKQKRCVGVCCMLSFRTRGYVDSLVLHV
jgi:hypothetical protein